MLVTAQKPSRTKGRGSRVASRPLLVGVPSQMGRRIGARHVVFVGCVLFSAAVAFAWGPGRTASWDSASYIDGARHLAAGSGYTTSRDALLRVADRGLSPITLWPPGFSLLMALVMLFGASTATASAVVLGASYVLMVSALCGVCLMAGPSRWSLSAVVLACVGVALMPSTLGATEAVLSDLPFAAFVLLAAALVLAQARLPRPSLLRAVVTGTAVAWTFWLRYAGAGVVVGLLAGMLLVRRGVPFKDRARALLTTAVTVAVIDGLLLVRNYANHGDLAGGRVYQASSKWLRVWQAARGVLLWAADAGPPSEGHLPVGVMYTLATVAAAGVLVALIRGGAYRSDAVTVLGSTLSGFLVAMVVAASYSQFNDLREPRFWLVTWPLSAAFVVAVFANVSPGVARWFLLPAGALGLLCGAVFLGSFGAGLSRAWEPEELSAEVWDRSAALLPRPEACGLLSNDIRPFLVHRGVAPSARMPVDIRGVNRARATGPLCIAFVKARVPHSASRYAKEQLAVIQALKKARRLRVLGRDDLVDVYRLVR
jgi:hypothetical protein